MKKYPKNKEDWKGFEVNQNEKELLIGNWQVMQIWERPLMKFLAKEVAWNHGNILEIGFGMGISAEEIIKNGCKSYTVIEAHPTIANNARNWAKKQRTQIKIIEGFWQEIVPTIKTKFDGILFDTFPINSKEKFSNHFPFIPVAPKLLKKNGVLTFFSDEKIPFRSKHLTLIFENFDEVKLVNIKGLNPPKHCEYWRENYMIIPVCKKIK
jgi:guanidinoacetate N-methyltransferase